MPQDPMYPDYPYFSQDKNGYPDENMIPVPPAPFEDGSVPHTQASALAPGAFSSSSSSSLRASSSLPRSSSPSSTSFTPFSYAGSASMPAANTSSNNLDSNISGSNTSGPNNSRITRTEIEHAVHVLLAQGENISINRVREITGRGSYSTISRILRDLGLGSPRLMQTRSVNTSITSEQDDLLRRLEEECIRLRSRCETLDQSLHDAINNKQQALAQLTDLEMLRDVVLRHLKQSTLMRELLQNTTLENLLPMNARPAIAPVQSAIKAEALKAFCRVLEQELNNGAPGYVGGVNSIRAIIAMLQDEQNKNRRNINEQAYHF